MSWKKFEGGVVPEGHEVTLFPHAGLMIRRKDFYLENRIVEQFHGQFELLKEKVGKGWPRPNIYVGVDMHQTAVKPTWTNDASTEFYPDALESLQMMSQDPEVVLILWTSSTPEQAGEYWRQLGELGVNFKYINENPECANTPYGDYTWKLYFNVGLDDKFGFKPKVDWPMIRKYFEARQNKKVS